MMKTWDEKIDEHEKEIAKMKNEIKVIKKQLIGLANFAIGSDELERIAGAIDDTDTNS